MLNFDFIGPHNITDTYGGWFHVYSFAIMTGIFVSIIASWVKFRRYGVSTDALTWSIVFIIPAALLGASWFGKDNPEDQISFWEKFSFWKQGMSIHGGVLFGIIVGGIIFYIVGRKSKISLWIYGDCIIPNILLGQVLGRWGNFFNHELLGSVVSYDSLSWLPAFIRDNCFKIINGDHQEIINGMKVFRAPIFLYESMGNLALWGIITFILPNVGKWFGKKPWKVEPNKYQFNIKNNIKQWGRRRTKESKNSTWTGIWNSAYYNYKPPAQKFTYTPPLKPDNLLKPIIPKFQSTNNWWKDCKQHFNLFIKKINKYTSFYLKVAKNKIGFYFKRKKDYIKFYTTRSKKLYEANNPKHYRMMYAGVQMGIYFFGWNLIRGILETQRDNIDLFLINRRTLDFVVLSTIAIVGLVIAVFAQFVAAKYCRNSGWTYEKEYY